MAAPAAIAVSAAPVTGAASPNPAAPEAPVAAAPDASFDPWVEVHAGNLRHNVAEIARCVGGRPVLAVIKNNGYGAGVVEAGRLLDPLPAVAGFAVVKLREAVALREAGIRKPILLMGPLSGEGEMGEAVARGVTPMVYTPVGDVLERIARARQQPVGIQVCVDTGIGRVGVPHARAASLVRDLAAGKGVRIDGVMMTFTEDEEFDKVQLRRFEELCAGLGKDVAFGKRHAVSSYGLFQRPDAFLDMVRPGMAVFGVYPEQAFRKMGVLDLRPAVALRARVIYVKQLRRGESAGYNRAYVARDDVWVATLPVGHADGWPRQAVKGAKVRIGGRLFSIVASVSASHTIVEVGPQPLVQIGDVATFFDWEDGSRPEDVNAACDVSVYDLTMHLNPLLPRRIV